MRTHKEPLRIFSHGVVERIGTATLRALILKHVYTVYRVGHQFYAYDSQRKRVAGEVKFEGDFERAKKAGKISLKIWIAESNRILVENRINAFIEERMGVVSAAKKD